MEQLERQVIRHEYEIGQIKRDLQTQREDIRVLKEDHQQLKEAVVKASVAAAATQQAAERTAANALSTKHLYIAAALVIVSIIGLIIGVKT